MLVTQPRLRELPVAQKNCRVQFASERTCAVARAKEVHGSIWQVPGCLQRSIGMPTA